MTTPGRPRRIWFWLLIVSVCINILLISFVTIAALRLPQLLTVEGTPRLVNVIARRLPSQDAETFRELYRTREPDFRAAQAQYRQALRRALEVAAQPKIDPEELRAAVNEARTLRFKNNDLLTDIFLQTLERMSPEVRQRLLARFRAR
jgi:uncharacterized membrane protein